MKEFGDLTGRYYELFNYYGDEDAEEMVVLMASGAHSCREVVDYLRNHEKRKVGILKVTLYRPWSDKHFLEKIPKTIKRVTILDKTNEDGASANPLYLDCFKTLK